MVTPTAAARAALTPPYLISIIYASRRENLIKLEFRGIKYLLDYLLSEAADSRMLRLLSHWQEIQLWLVWDPNLRRLWSGNIRSTN